MVVLLTDGCFRETCSSSCGAETGFRAATSASIIACRILVMRNPLVRSASISCSEDAFSGESSLSTWSEEGLSIEALSFLRFAMGSARWAAGASFDCESNTRVQQKLVLRGN